MDGAGFFGGLEGGEGGGVLFFGLGGLFLFFVAGDGVGNGVEEKLEGAAGAHLGFVEVGDGGERAEVGVESDLFDDLGLFGFGAFVGLEFGQVEAGDLEAVEEQTGAAGVDLVGGDALEDVADGCLDGGTVFGEWEVEGGLAVFARVCVVDGEAGGVEVVAELFSAQAWAAAAAAVGEDVAALVAFRLVLHDAAPSGYFLVKVFEGKGLGLDLRSRLSLFPVKCESPAFGRALFYFLLLFYRIGGN